MPWYPAYIGLGSNLNQPLQQIRAALAALQRLPDSQLLRASEFYGSKPFGPVAQPDYVNAVAALLTQRSAPSLFGLLRALESTLGREPARVRWGPRSIDLDLLVFADQQLHTPGLQLPHPGIVQRNFVLYPLRDLAPDLLVPGQGRVAELAARVESAGIWRLDPIQQPHGA